LSDGAAEGAEGAGDEGATTQRVDKWLWFARILKTRTLAAALVSSGKVRLNRAKIDKPGHIVRIGDVLTVTANSRVRLLKVTGVGERRGPSATAVTLYEELTPAADPLKPLARSPSQAGSDIGPPQGERPRGSGRPTKRERRQIDRLGDKFR
jgi:ribosome-associated heat shock protein Hsp15